MGWKGEVFAVSAVDSDHVKIGDVVIKQMHPQMTASGGATIPAGTHVNVPESK